MGVISAPWAIIVLWGLWGLSYTFTSGAYEAWITDEVGGRQGRAALPGRRPSRVRGGRSWGSACRSRSASVSLRAGVIVGGAITVVCGVLCVFLMPETGFRRQAARRAGVRADRDANRPQSTGARYAWAAPVILLLVARPAVHGHVRRGVRPAQGGALPARRRACRRSAASIRWSGSGSSGSPG